MSGELLHLQAGGLLPLRKPLFHAASCFVFECALTPRLYRHTGHDLFSTHPFQFTLSAYHPTIRNQNWHCAVKEAKTSEMVPTKITMKTYFLKCDAVKFGTQAPSCGRKMLSPSWHHLQNLSYSEEGHSTLIRIVGAHLPCSIVSQHTKINFIIRSDQSIMTLDILGVSELSVKRAWPNLSTLPVKESKSSLTFVTGSMQMPGQ